MTSYSGWGVAAGGGEDEGGHEHEDADQATAAHPGPSTLRHHDAVIGTLRAAGFSV